MAHTSSLPPTLHKDDLLEALDALKNDAAVLPPRPQQQKTPSSWDQWMKQEQCIERPAVWERAFPETEEKHPSYLVYACLGDACGV